MQCSRSCSRKWFGSVLGTQSKNRFGPTRTDSRSALLEHQPGHAQDVVVARYGSSPGYGEYSPRGPFRGTASAFIGERSQKIVSLWKLTRTQPLISGNACVTIVCNDHDKGIYRFKRSKSF